MKPIRQKLTDAERLLVVETAARGEDDCSALARFRGKDDWDGKLDAAKDIAAMLDMDVLWYLSLPSKKIVELMVKQDAFASVEVQKLRSPV